MPALSILQPANVRTPRVARVVFAAHLNVAPPAAVSASDTELVSIGTVRPLLSVTLTTGCAAKATFDVAVALGCLLNRSRAAVVATAAAMPTIGCPGDPADPKNGA